MKILYIVQHFSGPSGSSGSRPYENATRLVQMGHEVTLLCGNYHKATDKDIDRAREIGVKIYQSSIKYDQSQSSLQRIITFRKYMKWAIKKGISLPRPDLIYASSTPLTIGEVGRQIATHHQVPFVFEVRDLWPEIPITIGALTNPISKLLAVRMARRVYGSADHVIALSPGMKEGVMKWGVPDENITVIPNCSDIALFGCRDAREAERKQFGWSDKFVCVFCGSIGLANGLDYLLDCGKVLSNNGVNNIHIAIVGDGAEKERLAARIEHEKIGSVTVYDSVPKKDVPALLAASDVGVVSFLPIPYMNTNSANKFFDFLAAGLPVIINYDGWQESLLQESGAGFSVDPHEPGALAKVLMDLQTKPEMCQKMGLAARALAEEQFDRAKLVKNLEQLLLRVRKMR